MTSVSQDLKLPSPKNEASNNRQEEEEITLQSTSPSGELQPPQLDTPLDAYRRSDFFAAETPLNWEDFFKDDTVTTGQPSFDGFAVDPYGLGRLRNESSSGYDADVSGPSSGSSALLDSIYPVEPLFDGFASEGYDLYRPVAKAFELSISASSGPHDPGFDVPLDQQHVQPMQLPDPSTIASPMHPISPCPARYSNYQDPVISRQSSTRSIRRGKGRPFVCPICQRMFSTNHSLKVHTLSHTGERTLWCKEPGCNKRFHTKADCKRHERVHKTKFRCTNCGEEFTSALEKDHLEQKCLKQQDAKREMFLAEKREKVTASLGAIFKSVEHYRQLLSCKENDAQKILDAFQMLLDIEAFQDRGQLIAAMRRLSERTQLYPTRFCLSGPAPTSEDEPVAYGNFADIYKIAFRGEDTCYKVIRVYQRSQTEHVAKVYASEIIVWAQLSHLNILPFYGIIKYRSRIAFISCWAINGDLETYLAHNPDANRILICLDTAAGVEYLHMNDIVHGDLKGQNVLIDSSGRASLGDFGLSSVTDPQILKWASQSTVASKGGTTRWQAPELLGSEDTLDKVHNSKESDVFAWASICYEIFTQRLPFFEASYPATIMTIIMRGGTPTRPQDDDPAWRIHGLNNRIWGLMENCWNFKPSDRPDMTTVMSRLDTEKPVDSRPPGEWAEKASMRFRNAQDENTSSRDSLPFWEDLEVLLSRVVPAI